MFAQVAALSERRSELARQLITIQENTFRHISRELHDEFGQILTAIGAMLHRAGKKIPPLDDSLRGDFEEVREIVQSTLDKIRALSQALHPVVLDDAGLEGALDLYLPGFEKQTGIVVRYEKEGESRAVDRDVAIHVYRVVQEALNNVARHAKTRGGGGAIAVSPGGIGAGGGGPWGRVRAVEGGSRNGAGIDAGARGIGEGHDGVRETKRRRDAGANDGAQ